MLSELATVGRENQPKDQPPKLKDGLSAIHQTLGILVILIGLVAYVLNMRADVNTNRETAVALRAEIVLVRAEATMNADRLRQLEIKFAKIEK